MYDAEDYGMAGTFASFLGLGKAAKARREEKQQLRNDKKAAKTEVIKSRAEKNLAKAEKTRNQDPNAKSGAADLLGKGLDAVTGIFGKGGGDGGDGGDPNGKISGNVNFNAGDDEPKKDNTMMYVIIGVVVVVVVVVVIMVAKGKKKGGK